MSSVVTLEGKNVTRFVQQLKGVDPRISDIQNDMFTDVVMADGTELKDLTFSQLQAIAVSLEGKNITSISYEAKN